LSILKGTKARHKLIRITEMSADSLHHRLSTLCPELDL